jgi:hypothetical protein
MTASPSNLAALSIDGSARDISITPDGTNIVIRPIRPEDADLEKTFVRGLSDEAKYFRFMETIQELTPAMLVRFTQIDYDQEMALMAVTEVAGEKSIGHFVMRSTPMILRSRWSCR